MIEHGTFYIYICWCNHVMIGPPNLQHYITMVCVTISTIGVECSSQQCCMAYSTIATKLPLQNIQMSMSIRHRDPSNLQLGPKQFQLAAVATQLGSLTDTSTPSPPMYWSSHDRRIPRLRDRMKPPSCENKALSEIQRRNSWSSSFDTTHQQHLHGLEPSP